MSRQPLEPPCLVDDPLEEPCHRAVVQGTLIHRPHVREHLGLPGGLVHRLVRLLFQPPDRQSMRGPSVQQDNELFVDGINLRS